MGLSKAKPMLLNWNTTSTETQTKGFEFHLTKILGSIINLDHLIALKLFKSLCIERLDLS